MDWLHFREPVSAWTHGIWFILAFPACLLLWTAGRGDRIKQISLLVFGLSLIICFGGSVLYHALRLPPQIMEGWFAKADSIGIYLLIAGSITPVAVVVLQGAWRTITLASALPSARTRPAGSRVRRGSRTESDGLRRRGRS